MLAVSTETVVTGLLATGSVGGPTMAEPPNGDDAYDNMIVLEEMLRLSHRELQRIRSFMVVEQQSNRNNPQMRLPRSWEAYHHRRAETDRRIRQWIDNPEATLLADFVPDDLHAVIPG